MILGIIAMGFNLQGQRVEDTTKSKIVITVKPGKYRVDTTSCAELVISPDGTCYFETSKGKRKKTGTWKVSDDRLYLTVETVVRSKKSHVQTLKGKNGRKMRRAHYQTVFTYKIHNNTFIPEFKPSHGDKHSCGTYKLMTKEPCEGK